MTTILAIDPSSHATGVALVNVTSAGELRACRVATLTPPKPRKVRGEVPRDALTLRFDRIASMRRQFLAWVCDNLDGELPNAIAFEKGFFKGDAATQSHNQVVGALLLALPLPQLPPVFEIHTATVKSVQNQGGRNLRRKATDDASAIRAAEKMTGQEWAAALWPEHKAWTDAESDALAVALGVLRQPEAATLFHARTVN